MTTHRGTPARPAHTARLALGADLTTSIAHPALLSNEEVALDAVLAASVRDWDACHAHDVPLHVLLPDVDLSLLPAGVGLGTVLVRSGAVLGVVDVGHRDALRDGACRATTFRMLEEAGIPIHMCDVAVGPQALHAFHEAAEWVVTRVGHGAIPTVAEVRTLVVNARAEAVIKYRLLHVTPHLRAWQGHLGTEELTLEHYAERHEDMCVSEHPEATSMPTVVALQRMLDDAGVTLAAVAGRVAAERGQDGSVAAGESEPLYARRFPPGGWSLFLRAWGFDPGLVGLIAEHSIVWTLGLREAEWRAVSDDLVADATQPARSRSLEPWRFFEPSRVVPFLVERGFIAASEASQVLAELRAQTYHRGPVSP